MGVLLTPVMPAPAPEAAIAERLAFALRWDALAVLPLFAMIVAVGNERFLTADRPDRRQGKLGDDHQRPRRRQHRPSNSSSS